MLQELYIENFVIIDKVSIEFSPSFNVITGETGSGKTILVNALKLLLGDRFQKNYIGNSSKKSIVEGKFIIESKEKLDKFKDMGYELEDGVLIVTREVSKSNNSFNRINGRNVTLNFLKVLMEDLIDIHSQNENQTLLKRSNYIDILDSFNLQETKPILAQLESELSKLKDLKEKKESLDLSSEEVDREKDILGFQIQELSSLDLENIDEEELENELRLLTNMDNIKTSINRASQLFRTEEFGHFEILNAMSEIMSSFKELSELDLELKPIFDRIESSYFELEDLYNEIQNYSDRLYFDEVKLEELNEKLRTITELKRKYGPTITDLIEFRDKALKRLDTLNSIEENISSLDKEIQKVYSSCRLLSDQLTKLRKIQGKALEKDILQNIRNLNMPNAKFEIVFEENEQISSKGKDNIDFYISTNVGQKLMPLSKIASGGELSRIMLALKTSLASIDNVETLIFDEVDTGISGRTAILVGEKLQKISKVRQIITISHLAQIASLANFHILIEKNEDLQGTISNIRSIDEDERISEISRLIGGVDITENTIQQAKDMLIQGKKLFNLEENYDE
ncbi:DNA repair protein RecN [Lagierella sp.]|uniref:DNA repair protein RecN n=1 Tax=Lagierella sp. TaxID=2849657 RepID=UPI002639FC24|nr:DNA repair protein RecN [Lagierella sp.]